jgi:hypothetical protein
VQFRHKYIIEAKNLEHAYDTVLIDHPEYLTQKYLDENIIDGRKIDRKEFERICSESMKDDSYFSKVIKNYLEIYPKNEEIIKINELILKASTSDSSSL